MYLSESSIKYVEYFCRKAMEFCGSFSFMEH